MRIKEFTFIIIIITISLTGCKEDNFTFPNEQLPFSGIVVTNANGFVLKEDSLDWQPRYTTFGSMNPDSIYFEPAYPNPAGITLVEMNDTLRIGFIIVFTAPNGGSSIKIYLKNQQNKILFNLFDDSILAGRYSIFFTLGDKPQSELPNGIYRVFFDVNIGGSNSYSSFGDVEIKR